MRISISYNKNSSQRLSQQALPDKLATLKPLAIGKGNILNNGKIMTCLYLIQ